MAWLGNAVAVVLATNNEEPGSAFFNVWVHAGAGVGGANKFFQRPTNVF